MGKAKFDLITASRQKKYRLTVAIVAIVGLVLLFLGWILMNTVTRAVMPNKLVIKELTNLEGTNGSYTMTISQDERIWLDTGTGTNPLLTPITFTLQNGADKILKPIADSYRAGIFDLRLRDNIPDGATGTLLIQCGSMQPVQIIITYYAV